MKGKLLNIGGKKVGEGQKVFIIAEAGVNHNGNLRTAQKMIDAAKEAGADSIKFQTYITEELVTSDAPMAEYQKKNISQKTQYAMLKKLELSEFDFQKLYEHCKKRKIVFLSSPFDLMSADFLNRLGISAFKIASGEINNKPLLAQIARYGKPVILSTGMSDMAEVRDAVRTIHSNGNKKLVLLHCTSNYPARYEDVNLKAISKMKKAFTLPIGYSDHTKGIEISIAAAASGACIIEKHFTLDRGMVGPDHKASLEPGELKELVRSIRNVEAALGSGKKVPAHSEFKIRKVARKSLVASRDIKKGERFDMTMLSIKRPGTGIEPKFLHGLMNKKAKRDIKKDSLLDWSSVS